MPSLFETIQQKKHIDLQDITEFRSYMAWLIQEGDNQSCYRPLPFSKELIGLYEELIEAHLVFERDSICMMIETTNAEAHQVFETEVTVGEDKGFIRYLFPLPYVMARIKQLAIPVQEIDVSVLYTYSSCIEVDTNYQPTTNEPIVALQYPYAEPGFLVLDGNHRIVQAKKEGKKAMKAYLLHEEAMAILAPQQVFYKLYLIHKNISHIRLYMEGQMSLSELKSVYVRLSSEQWTI